MIDNIQHGRNEDECEPTEPGGSKIDVKMARKIWKKLDLNSNNKDSDREIRKIPKIQHLTRSQSLPNFKKHLTALPHIDKVSEFKSKGGVPPVHLDPSFVLGQDANELAKQSCCDICPKSPNQPVTKFKSTYHFFKHIRSKGHFERIVQLIKNGQGIASHLVPPNLHIDEHNASTSDVFFLETV